MQVRATNAGHTSPLPTQATWRVDTTAAGTHADRARRPGLVDGMRTAATTATFCDRGPRCRKAGRAQVGAGLRGRLLPVLSPGRRAAELLGGLRAAAPEPRGRRARAGGVGRRRERSQGPDGGRLHVDRRGDGARDGDRRRAGGGVGEPGGDVELRALGEADGFECRVDSGAWAACPAAHRVAGLADGDHRLEARALFAGRPDATPAAWTWRVDSGPTTAITAGPPAVGDARTVTFTVAVDDPAATLACRLDGGAWAPCSRTPSYAVGAGEHRFEARATDVGGQVGDTATWTWTTDLTPPDTVLTASAPALSRFRSELLVRGGERRSASNAASTAATGRRAARTGGLGGLADGAHVAQARAVTVDGRIDPTPAELRWATDGTAPVVAVTHVTPAQAARHGELRPHDERAGRRGRVPRGPGRLRAVLGRHVVSGLGPGRHILVVRAPDAAGNQATPLSSSWTQLAAVDADTEILSGPNPAVAFSGTGPTFRCRVDTAAWTPCTSPHTPSAAPGTHTFQVAAVDTDERPEPPPPRLHADAVAAAPPSPRPADPTPTPRRRRRPSRPRRPRPARRRRRSRPRARRRPRATPPPRRRRRNATPSPRRRRPRRPTPTPTARRADRHADADPDAHADAARRRRPRRRRLPPPPTRRRRRRRPPPPPAADQAHRGAARRGARLPCRQGRAGQAVKARLAPAEAGRLTVRVLDSRRRTLSTASLRFAKPGRRR